MTGSASTNLFPKHLSDPLMGIIFGFVEVEDLIGSENVDHAWRQTIQRVGYNRLLEEMGITKKSDDALSKQIYLSRRLQKIQVQMTEVACQFRQLMSLPFTHAGRRFSLELELSGDLFSMQYLVRKCHLEISSAIRQIYTTSSNEIIFVNYDDDRRFLLQAKKRTIEKRLQSFAPVERAYQKLQNKGELVLEAIQGTKGRLPRSKSDDKIFQVRKFEHRILRIIRMLARGVPKNR